MPRRGKLPANVAGDRVWNALTEARPAGMTRRQLILATELTAWQVTRGIRFIREALASASAQPMIWVPREGYLLTDDPGQWIAYEKAQFKLVLGMLQRLISGPVAPHAARMPEDDTVQLIMKQLVGVSSAIEMLTKIGARR